MPRFSERYGFKPARIEIQKDSMDADLRNGLWNALSVVYFEKVAFRDLRSVFSDFDRAAVECTRAIWADFLKRPLDAIPLSWSEIYEAIRKFYFKCQWDEVYDFVEFVPQHFPYWGTANEFRAFCNTILERELSAYRFVGDYIAPLTSQEEIEAVNTALADTWSLRSVYAHLDAALSHLSNRTSPDYRNSIKESVSSVEALCRLIVGSNATLGDCLKTVHKSLPIHGALRDAYSKIYGWTSDAEGIRHSLMDEPNLQFDDAKFMLVSCSAFVNYMIGKASSAGIRLK